MITVRDERPEDIQAIRGVAHRAFGRAEEADLVELIRDAQAATVSLVAVRLNDDGNSADAADAAVIGHILFSPVTINSGPAAAAVRQRERHE